MQCRFTLLMLLASSLARHIPSQRQITKKQINAIVDFGKDRSWVARFELQETDLDQIKTIEVFFNTELLQIYSNMFRTVQVQLLVYRGDESYIVKFSRKFDSIKKLSDNRSLLRLSDSNIRKLKMRIFSFENRAEMGMDALDYPINDETPLLILGLTDNKFNRMRREAHFAKSRSRRSSLSAPAGNCNKPFEYLVQLNVLKGSTFRPSRLDIKTCVPVSQSRHNTAHQFFQNSRGLCSLANPDFRTHSHAFLRKNGASAYRHEANLLCVPSEYKDNSVLMTNQAGKQTTAELLRTIVHKCECR